MPDKFYKHYTQLDDPFDGGFAIAKNDATVLDQPTRGIYVGTAGDLHVMMASSANTELTFTGLLAGTVYNIRVKKVYATGSTANNLIGLF